MFTNITNKNHFIGQLHLSSKFKICHFVQETAMKLVLGLNQLVI